MGLKIKKVVKQVISGPGLNAFKNNNRASLLDLTIRNTLQFFCFATILLL